jgi:holliday junction DNA helicase RuvB
MPVERFTLVGATTRFGLLTPPMRARFGIVQRLNFYAPDDLAEIITRSAEILNVECTRDGAARSRAARAARRAWRTGCCGGSATTRRSGRRA